jgi:hypothetical protein
MTYVPAAHLKLVITASRRLPEHERGAFLRNVAKLLRRCSVVSKRDVEAALDEAMEMLHLA